MRSLAPGRIIFCSEWMTASVLSALLLAFHRAAHVERFLFLRPGMSPPVTGLRRKVGGAVMSAVRRLAVRVNHLDHRAV